MSKMLRDKIQFMIKDQWNREDGGMEVYASISKSATAGYFERAGAIPTNEDGEEDFSFIGGDVQYMFNAEGGLDEVLLFPVYEFDDMIVNGQDFIDAPEELQSLGSYVLNKVNNPDLIPIEA